VRLFAVVIEQPLEAGPLVGQVRALGDFAGLEAAAVIGAFGGGLGVAFPAFFFGHLRRA